MRTRRRASRHLAAVAGAVALLAAAAAGVPGAGAAPLGISPAPPSLTVYPLPSATAKPSDLKVGPNGNLWAPYNFTGPNGLAEITPTGAVTEHPFAMLAYAQVALGGDGNLWVNNAFARQMDKVGPDGAVLAAYPTEVNQGGGGMTAGPDGNVWWGESNLGKIGRITPDGVVTSFTVPYGPGGVYDVAAGPDGNVWYTNPFGDAVGRITPSGQITEFRTPAGPQYHGPLGMTAGTDGNLWYADSAGRIGRVTTAGQVTEYVLPGGMVAQTLAPDAGGSIWFTTADGSNLVGRLAPDGSVGVFQAAGLGFSSRIVLGPDGRLWYTMPDAGSVAAFVPVVLTPVGPDVQDVSPRWAPSTGGGTVVVTGYHIGAATKVLFGSTAASFRVLGPGQLEAVVPKHATGRVSVTVVTPAGRTAVTDQSRFFYASPACGTVITQSTTLTADVGPCYEDGVVVGADGVTLDLGGHRISNFQGGSDGSAAGVRLPHRTGVTVRNGTVQGFDAGVVVRGGGGNVLTGLTVLDNVGPDDIGTAELGDGIFVEDSAGNHIVANTVSHNGVYDGIGVYGGDADGNVITDNVVEDTVGPAGHGPAGDGIITNGAAGDGSPTSIEGSVVERNTVRDNAAGGIANVNTVGGRVVGNTVVGNGLTNSFGNGIGISVGFNWDKGPTGMVIQGNAVHRNGVDGIRVGNPVGFSSGNPTGNRILDNDASGNAANVKVDTYEFHATGYDLRDRNPGCADNVWSGNTWGGAGYTPACTAAGGSGPAFTAATATADAATADTLAWERALNHGRR